MPAAELDRFSIHASNWTEFGQFCVLAPASTWDEFYGSACMPAAERDRFCIHPSSWTEFDQFCVLAAASTWENVMVLHVCQQLDLISFVCKPSTKMDMISSVSLPLPMTVLDSTVLYAAEHASHWT